MYTILHGEDEFSRSEQVQRMRAELGDPQFADLNIARLDGRRVTVGELAHACDSIPFLAEKRLVIVEGMLTRFEARKKKGGDSEEDKSAEPEADADPELREKLRDYLARVPTSTNLVFVESKSLARNNPVLKQALGDRKNAHVIEFKPPELRDLPGWIRERVHSKHGKIEPRAVDELAAHVGSDLRLLDNEIDKLLMYCGERAISEEDVRVLVASVRETIIFDLVDAVGECAAAKATRLLHEMLDQNAAPLYLLAMITRQFRMLLQIRDLLSRGLNRNAVRDQLKLHPFVLEKTAEQAGNFSLAQLEGIYERLLETDLAIKTGRSDPVVALDVLVMELTRSQ